MHEKPNNPPSGIHTGGPDGARIDNHYIHRTEDAIAVRRSDLHEISKFGWLEEGCGASGVFFFSGAFWLLVTLLAEHMSEYHAYIPWFILCFVCMVFGAVLIWLAHNHFTMRQLRIAAYFDDREKVNSLE